MIRFLFWVTLWLLTLCAATIDVTYNDGLHLKFKGWWKAAKGGKEGT